MDWKPQYCQNGDFPKLIYNFHAIPIKISDDFLLD